jgi:deoxyribodipyrimidine photo-lyase
MKNITIFWFRRDLRLEDNAGLYHALKNNENVLPLFIFDRNILDDLEDKKDARVAFLHHTLSEIKEKLQAEGRSILIKYGKPVEIWASILQEFAIKAVYTNHDFEPYAIARDEAMRVFLQENKIEFHTFKDHVIFEKNEVTKDDGKPYTVFTPYSNKWKAKLKTRLSKVVNSEGKHEEISYYFKSYPCEKYANNFLKTADLPMPTLAEMGFNESNITIPSTEVSRGIIRNYDQTRNFPRLKGTSQLGIHFRFGTISIREKARNAQNINEIYLNELIWRDFYSQIMTHFPHVVGNSFRPQYDRIPWRNEPKEFEKWCEGKTGYPIVDAGMRELNATGFMHNRVRMVVASFLTKHLLMDWRLGEAYFAKKLLDFDLASNNGGWQWAAGCGTDAAPYFRVFNPTEQQKKFDADFVYIKKWVPEYGTSTYPKPMVEHVFARNRCLEVYKAALTE